VPTVERHVTSTFGKLGPRQSDADQHRGARSAQVPPELTALQVEPAEPG
jgi:hypothetical protein